MISPEHDRFRNRLIKIMSIIAMLAVMFSLVFMMMSSGCLSMAKSAAKELTATPVPTPTPNIIIEVLETTPEPTPTLSEAQILAASGGLHKGEWLSWQCENTSGLKDLEVHTTVYDYRMFGFIHWWSILWGQYFIEGPGEGKKFLFVFIHTYSEDESPTTWGVQPEQYYIEANGVIYNQTTRIPPEIRIKELDEVWNMDHVENIKPYGYLRTYDNQWREIAEPLGFLKAGKSNAWDGYVVFTIPEETTIDDIKIIGDFHHLAPAHYWILK